MDPAAPETSASLTVRLVTAEDWRQVRALRLRMLQDTPKAYLESYESARDLSDEQWRERVARRTSEDSAAFAAVAPDGRWVGTVAVFLETPAQTHLVGVFVEPDWRGRGCMDLLLMAAQAWSRGRGASIMRLFVHEDSPRARAYYRKAGFVETGASMPYELDPTETDLEMSQEL